MSPFFIYVEIKVKDYSILYINITSLYLHGNHLNFMYFITYFYYLCYSKICFKNKIMKFKFYLLSWCYIFLSKS